MTEDLSGPLPAIGIPAISRKPLYFVIFEATGVTSGEYVSLVDASAPDYLQSVTLPHLLDRDLVPVLPVIWYCLHLPATCFDLQSQPSSVTKKLQGLDFSHEIFLSSFEKF